MAELTVPSGAVVVINPASWKEAKQLKKAIEREIALTGSLSLPAVLLVDSSDAVDAALAPCLARCLYDNEKIIEKTFDDPKARADYYDIVVACVKENLAPLAESLLLKLKEYGIVKKQADTGNAPKSA
jgi:threonine aldolase